MKIFLMTGSFPQGQNVNSEFYSNHLGHVKDEMKENSKGSWGTMYLLARSQDVEVITSLWFEYIDHRPYSANLAKSEHFLLLNLK